MGIGKPNQRTQSTVPGESKLGWSGPTCMKMPRNGVVIFVLNVQHSTLLGRVSNVDVAGANLYHLPSLGLTINSDDFLSLGFDKNTTSKHLLIVNTTGQWFLSEDILQYTFSWWWLLIVILAVSVIFVGCGCFCCMRRCCCCKQKAPHPSGMMWDQENFGIYGYV